MGTSFWGPGGFFDIPLFGGFGGSVGYRPDGRVVVNPHRSVER